MEITVSEDDISLRERGRIQCFLVCYSTDVLQCVIYHVMRPHDTSRDASCDSHVMRLHHTSRDVST